MWRVKAGSRGSMAGSHSRRCRSMGGLPKTQLGGGEDDSGGRRIGSGVTHNYVIGAALHRQESTVTATND